MKTKLGLFIQGKKVLSCVLILGVFFLISVVLISANLTFQEKSIVHTEKLLTKADCWKTIPQDYGLDVSSDGGEHHFSSVNARLGSEEFSSIVNSTGGYVYTIAPVNSLQTYYISPSLSSDNPCVDKFDFLDVSGKGHNQWVFRFDSNPHLVADVMTYVSTITVLPIQISEVHGLFAEIKTKIDEQSFPSKQNSGWINLQIVNSHTKEK